MSLRTFERLLLASSLALGAGFGVGCSDDGGGGGSKTDAGADSGVDSGRIIDDDDDDAGTDSGSGPQIPPTLENANGDTCAPVKLLAAGDYADACWIDEEAGVCGVDTRKLPGGDPNAPDVACVRQDVEGKASAYCGAFFDQTDAIERDGEKKIVTDDDGNPLFVADYQDGALTVVSSGLTLRFEGCCLPSGECGAMLTTPSTGPNKDSLKPFTSLNLHLGCTSVTELAARLADPEAEPVDPAKVITRLPYCDYESEDAGPPSSGNVIPGFPVYACGCGVDVVADGCLPNLSEDVCGAIPADAGTAPLDGLPEFVCGCDGTLLRIPEEGVCLRNVSVDACGNENVEDGSAWLATVPTFVCGCGENVAVGVSSRFCLSNVASNVCGSAVAEVDADATPSPCLVGLPEYAHGCGVDVLAPTPSDPTCLRATPAYFGCGPVTENPQRIPEFLCGCGNDARGADGYPIGIGAYRLPCLPYVPETTCGNTEVTTSAQVAAWAPTLPNNACGCGEATISSAACLDNIPATACGPRAVCAVGAEVGTELACPAGTVCVDLLGGAAPVVGDGILDYCAPQPTT